MMEPGREEPEAPGEEGGMEGSLTQGGARGARGGRGEGGREKALHREEPLVLLEAPERRPGDSQCCQSRDVCCVAESVA